jgi:hypothetical protein
MLGIPIGDDHRDEVINDGRSSLRWHVIEVKLGYHGAERVTYSF